MSFSAVGQVWDLDSFRDHIKANAHSIKKWAKGVTIHHTAGPNLAQRPKGWVIQHMRNLQHFYIHEKDWSKGPHLFTDEDQVFGLSPVTAPGIHAKSFNSKYLGIEALGDYDYEDDPLSGRGKQVWANTAAAVAILLDELGWDESSINFHRDDPRTSKTCPGRRVSRDFFLNLVRESVGKSPEPETSFKDPDKADENRDPNQVTGPDEDLIAETLTRINNAEWQLKKLRELYEAK